MPTRVRLARYLRLLGFDTLFKNDPGDAALVRISLGEGRILLSRDRRLLERRGLIHSPGYLRRGHASSSVISSIDWICIASVDPSPVVRSVTASFPRWIRTRTI